MSRSIIIRDFICLGNSPSGLVWAYITSKRKNIHYKIEDVIGVNIIETFSSNGYSIIGIQRSNERVRFALPINMANELCRKWIGDAQKYGNDIWLNKPISNKLKLDIKSHIKTWFNGSVCAAGDLIHYPSLA